MVASRGHVRVRRSAFKTIMAYQAVGGDNTSVQYPIEARALAYFHFLSEGPIPLNEQLTPQIR